MNVYNPNKVASVLDFLQREADKGLAINTSEVQVAALFLILERILSNNFLVNFFFSVLLSLKPPPHTTMELSNCISRTQESTF